MYVSRDTATFSLVVLAVGILWAAFDAVFVMAITKIKVPLVEKLF